MKQNEQIRRYLIFLAGVFFAASGIGVLTAAGLGTSPVSSLALVLANIFPLSLGTFVFITNTAMLLGEILLLGRRFEIFQLLQLPCTFLFSVFVDFSGWLAAQIPMPSYSSQMAVLLLGCVLLALGVALEMLAEVLILPAEGFVRVLSIVTKKDFGLVKTLFDIGMVISSVLLSLAVLDRVEGIREGTLIAALIVGGIARFFCQRLKQPLLGR